MAALELDAPSAAERPSLTLAFDFDNTVIASNSDTVIPRTADGGAHAAAFDKGLNAFGSGESWTKFMDSSLATMAANGATVEAITAAAREITIEPVFADALREIAAMPNTQLLIISDANTLFISEIIAANDLEVVFDPIITNPSYIVELTAEATASLRAGGDAAAAEEAETTSTRAPAPTRLAVLPYTLEAGAHETACPPNLCKTTALRAEVGMASAAERAAPGAAAAGVRGGRYVYVGDGSNDVCPCVNLLDGDDGECIRNNMDACVGSW